MLRVSMIDGCVVCPEAGVKELEGQYRPGGRRSPDPGEFPESPACFCFFPEGDLQCRSEDTICSSLPVRVSASNGDHKQLNVQILNTTRRGGITGGEGIKELWSQTGIPESQR